MAEVAAGSIAVLPSDVAARIAAGEVIERPASVVKELVENALDSGARRVEVTLEGGGLELVRVADDGCGIHASDVPLAFERHGTSKLRTDADLERIATLGFRGEALPSLAAVADVLLQTRAVGEQVGSSVWLSAGRIVRQEALARQPGTTVTVQDVFADLPARRKFLRARSTEGALCAQVVAHLALARPEVAFRLVADGRSLFSTPGDGDLRLAALAVRGPSFARGASDLGPLEVVASNGRTLGRIYGLLGPTQEQRSARSGMSLFVNGRWVQNRALAHAVEEAYRTRIRTGRHPVAIVFLEVPPETVDVNVHPAKSEVRLLHERELYGPLQQAILAALPPTQHSWLDEALDPTDEEPLLDAEPLRVLGQAGATYLVVEGARGLYLIDQHAAHERVLLERLRDHHAARAERQGLLVPEVIDLPVALGLEPELVGETLNALGFDAEPFGERSVLVRSVPGILAERRALGGLEDALASVTDLADRLDWRERLSLELACRTAIKAGDSLGQDEMLSLVQQLGEARLGETCAHGRPTSVLLSHDQLARQFGRT